MAFYEFRAMTDQAPGRAGAKEDGSEEAEDGRGEGRGGNDGRRPAAAREVHAGTAAASVGHPATKRQRLDPSATRHEPRQKAGLLVFPTGTAAGPGTFGMIKPGMAVTGVVTEVSDAAVVVSLSVGSATYQGE